MNFSLSNKQNTHAVESLQSKPADVKYVSAHKEHFKSWRSNKMYKSVRYSQQSLFGIPKIFSPVNLFALMFISFFLFSCSKQKDQVAGQEQKNSEQARMEASLPGFS